MQLTTVPGLYCRLGGCHRQLIQPGLQPKESHRRCLWEIERRGEEKLPKSVAEVSLPACTSNGNFFPSKQQPSLGMCPQEQAMLWSLGWELHIRVTLTPEWYELGHLPLGTQRSCREKYDQGPCAGCISSANSNIPGGLNCRPLWHKNEGLSERSMLVLL